MAGAAPTIDEGDAAVDHAEQVTVYLDRLQYALTERWQDTIVTAVRSDTEIPRPYTALGDRYTPPDLHRNAAMAAHLAVGECDGLAWYDGGRSGSAPSTCHGRTAPEGVTEFRTFLYRDQQVEIPLTVDCCMPALLPLAEDWSWQTREHVRPQIPAFANQSIANLKTARDAYASISTAMGLPAEAEEYSYSAEDLAGFVDFLAIRGGDANEAWMSDWTGLAADSASSGYLASTAPTLMNHVALATDLANLITFRYEIIKNYRASTIAILNAATAKLGATVTTTETTDLGMLWMAVSGSGTGTGVVGDAMSLVPVVKDAAGVVKVIGSGLRMLGWTGTNFAMDFEITIEQFEFSPEEVVIGLLDEIEAMKDQITASEDEYKAESAKLRGNLNAVPSEFLELYDFSRNEAGN